MGTGDLAAFRTAGRALAALDVVVGSEGNLSTWDGQRLRITRTGTHLAEIGEDDVLEGTLDDPPAEASSDLDRHVWVYRDDKGRAVVHCHPAGTIPPGWGEGEPHGLFTHGLTLEDAVVSAAYHVAQGGLAPPGEGMGSSRLPRAVEFYDYRPLTVGRGTDDRRVFPGGALHVLDQTALPAESRWRDLGTVQEVADAIRRLVVRGAPVLGVVAAYALVLAAREAEGGEREEVLEAIERAGGHLVLTRPTAVSIRWAVDRVLGRARATDDARSIPGAVLAEARAIEVEDAEACAAMGRLGSELVPSDANVLTHCNTGMLCTAGIGTALGVTILAHLLGRGVHVWVDETRPVLQGARLTAWELQRLGVPYTLIADVAAGALMAAGRVDLVVVGADRIAGNGDVANKVGTYALAALASLHGVPFYVVAPTSSIDLATPSGGDILIEERDPAEVTAPFGVAIAPERARVANPAFDVTPAELVTALVTERGIVRGPNEDALRSHLAEARSA